MALLYFRDPNTGQLQQVEMLDGNAGSTGAQGPVTAPSGAISANAGNSARLGTDGGVYAALPADGGLPVGAVVPYGGSLAPSGWFLCDGSPHGSAALGTMIGPNTPDLRDRFIRGAGTQAPGMTGGADSILVTPSNMPSHNHGNSGFQSSDHTHAGSMASGGTTHSHTGSTGTESSDHSHQRPAQGSGGRSANHTHVARLNDGSGESGDSKYVDSNPNNSGNTKSVGTAAATTQNHTHTAAAWNTNGRSAGHTHVATSSSSSVEHSHAVTSGTQSVGHTHSVPAQGGGQSIPTVPGHFVLTYLIRG